MTPVQTDPTREYDFSQLLPDRFEAQVAAAPERVAVSCAGVSLTYAELNNRANHVTHRLQTSGISANDLVGLAVERSAEMLIGLLGILKAGAAYVPIDPSYPAERVRHMVDSAEITTLITQSHLQDRFPSELNTLLVKQASLPVPPTQAGMPVLQNPTRTTKPTDRAYVIFTSGSTGKPKGVQIPHRALVNFLLTMQERPGIKPDDTLLAVTTISFDIAALELYLPLITGAHVVIATDAEQRDSFALGNLIEQHCATVMQATPATWRLLLASGWNGSPTLKILCGGEAMPQNLAGELLKRGSQLWNLYGPTEATVWATIHHITEADLIGGGTPVTIGTPIANTTTHILDKNLQPVASGEVGDLYIGGVQLADGYLNRPKLSAERFIPHPSAFRLYKTGDLAKLEANGTLTFLGREDFQVKVRGFRIEAGEVEAVLEQHETVSSAVVLARPSADGDNRLIAWIVPTADRAVDRSALRTHLAQFVPDYMIPSAFVALATLPLTDNGKLNRNALPDPDHARPQLDTPFTTPRTDLERHIATTWQTLLNIEPIGIHDRWHDLGGDSIGLITLITHLEDTLNFSLTDLQLSPTAFTTISNSINVLGDRLRSREPEGGVEPHSQSRLQPRQERALENDNTPTGDATILSESAGAQPAGERRDSQSRLHLTRNQYLMWMGGQLLPGEPLYSVPMAFTVRGGLDVARFQRAFVRLQRQHDVLRSVIILEGQEPVLQVRDEPLLAELPVIAPDDESVWLDERAKRPFDMTDRLIDSALLQLADDHFVWFVNLHHVITDGHSTMLLVERLAELYEADRDVVPAVPQMAAYTAHERAFSESKRAARYAEFWRDLVAVELEPTTFYGDLPAEIGAKARRQTVVLSAEKTTALKSLATTQPFQTLSSEMSQSALFGTVLTALLHRISDKETIRLGSPIHVRSSAEFKQTLGLLMEFGLLETTVANGDTLQTLFQKVAQSAQNALLHTGPGTSDPAISRAHDVVLNYIVGGQNSFAGLPLEAEWLHPGSNDLHHKLMVQIEDYGETGQLRVHFDCKEDLFSAEQQQTLIDQFFTVFDALLEDQNRPIGAIPLITADFADHLTQFNATDHPLSEKTIIDLFREQVQQTPDAIAINEGDQNISYSRLDARTDALAAFLIEEFGVGAGVTVGLLVEHSAEAIIGILATLKAGGAFVPLDPAYPAERLAWIVEDAAPALILTNLDNPDLSVPVFDLRDPLRPPSTGSGRGFDTLATEGCAATQDATLHLATGNRQPTPNDLSYIIYTSGSTGKPKGVLLHHRGLLNYATWAHRSYVGEGIAADFPLFSSLSFDLTITSIFVPLICGGRVVVYPSSDNLTVLRVFEEDQVDVVKLTPAHLALVAEAGTSVERIRRLILGGEDLKTDLVRRAQTVISPHLEIFNEYGPTEATVGCMIHRFDPKTDTRRSVPIGKPAANMQIHILDRYGQPVPTGVIGEMVIAGVGVANGYLNRPKLTAERFSLHPSSFSLYKTGDLARWLPDGTLEFLGRADHQVKVRGARVELGEIEATLLQHPAIREAVAGVVAVERVQTEATLLCTKCGMPSNYPGITFNAGGVCSLCLQYEQIRPKVDQWFRDENELRGIVERVRANATGKYDCLIMVSGGKDSTYMLYELVALGLNPLVFSLDNGYISEDAKANIRRTTTHLGVDNLFATTEHMRAIFADSLTRYSNVCQGCFKTIYTLAYNVAHEHGIKAIFTGLSRGQFFETRLTPDLFASDAIPVEQVDQFVVEARKAYHRVDDAVNRLLPTAIFENDNVIDTIEVIDFYRYADVPLDQVYARLNNETPWRRPSDTGRSTNCVINDVGIYVHQKEQGYHNYALPYSWDVRLGHKEREAALYELNDELNVEEIGRMLTEVGYVPTEPQADQRLVVWYAGEVESAELHDFLREQLPAFMLPSHLVQIEQLPLTRNGKIDRAALPNPTGKRMLDEQAAYVAPRSEPERLLTDIWATVLQLERVGIHDNFFRLGGDSIASIQIVAQAWEMGWEIAPGRIFQLQTPAELATEMIPTKVVDDSADFQFDIEEDDLADIMAEFGD